MTLNVVRCADVMPTPWRNGAGLSRDLLTWPAGADWHVRISVADIDVDSPFSAYPDVDRWFAVIEGAGVHLRLRDGLHGVITDGPALHFRGEDAPACELIGGPTRDLNLMCRRGKGHAAMRRAEVGVAFDDRARLRALFTADTLTLRTGAGEALALSPFNLAWAHGASAPWHIDCTLARPRAWWMTFNPQDQR
jgi:environmental stress-induced protein Ves